MTPRRPTLPGAVLTLGALVGTLCLVATVGSWAFGLRPLVFQSGSMSPAIATGDLAVARRVPASELSVGEVVAVRTGSGSRVSHRIVDVTHRPGGATLVLKGDANPTADAEPYEVAEAERIWFAVPAAGYVLAWLSGPAGMALGAVYVLFLVATLHRQAGSRAPVRSGREDVDPRPDLLGRRPMAKGVPAPRHLAQPSGAPRRRRRRVGRRASGSLVAAALLVGAVSGGAVMWRTQPTLAAWTDLVGTSGTSLTARTVPAPVASCGVLGIGSVRVNWTAVPGATGYTLSYGAGGTTTEEVGPGVTSKSLTGLVSGGTFSVRAKAAYGSTTWTSVPSNALSYSVLLFLVGLCS